MPRNLTALALVLGASAGFASAQTTVVSDNFNSYNGVSTGTAPLSANWSIYAQPNNNNVASVVNAVGISGTQSLSTSTASGNEWSVTNRTGFDLSVPVTVSFFYLRGANATGVAQPQINLAGSATDFYNSAGSVGIRINQASTWQTYVGNGTGGTAASIPAGSITGSAATTQGNWYHFSATFTRISANQISVSGALSNATSAGVIGSLVSSTAPLTLTTVLGADTSTFALVRANMTQIAAIDNFSVTAVPEPSAYAMAAALFCGLLVVLRRRAQHVA